MLSLAFVSCSRDELADTKGEPLPQGEYPMELSAGGLQTVTNQAQASTRATVDDDWNGVSTVAVQVEYDVKSYNVTSADGGKTATLSSDNPFYWERANETKTITAWHPYSKFYPTDWTVKADQSTAASYQTSDLVRGELTDLAFADRNDPSKNKMTFAHQTAKVVVNLVAGDGVTLDANTSVKLLNISGVEKGSTITFYKPAANTHTYLALLNGQLIRAKSSFIQVETSGGTFVYKPQTSKTLQAGTAYTYDITVKANGIEVTETTGSEWTDGGSKNVVSNEIYKASDLKLGDYYYSDGTWSDGGLRKRYADGTMKWEETTPQPESGKTVVGIVFHVGHHENDKSDYTSTGIGQKQCHGYAVALTDASSDRCIWGYAEMGLGCCPTDDNGNYRNNLNYPDIDWNGYAWTQKIINAAGGKDNLNATKVKGYPATYYAVVDYQSQVTAPAKSSGWFLPSIGQMRNIYRNRLSLFDYRPGAAQLKFEEKLEGYFSSSECYVSITEYILILDRPYGGVASLRKESRRYVRPVLAF